MTITLVNHAFGTTTSEVASWTVSIPAPAAGNLLICATIAACALQTTPIASAPTDNLGATWTSQVDATFNVDVRVDAKVAVGTETTVTCNVSPTTGGVGIVLELHSTTGPLSLGAIYATNTSLNQQYAGSLFFPGAPVTVVLNADWVIGFMGYDAADGYTFRTWSPWTTVCPTTVSTGTGQLVTGADASHTGATGVQRPYWKTDSGGSNLNSAVLAVTDSTVSPPIPASTWW